MATFSHIPVMLEECMQGLAVRDGGTYFDGTVGGGNHSYEILRRSSPSGRLIATDLDDEAIAAATQKLRLVTFISCSVALPGILWLEGGRCIR